MILAAVAAWIISLLFVMFFEVRGVKIVLAIWNPRSLSEGLVTIVLGPLVALALLSFWVSNVVMNKHE